MAQLGGTRDREETLAKLQRSIDRPLEIVGENVLPVAVVLSGTGRVFGDFILRWASNEH